MGVFTESNMGIAVRELFNDAGSACIKAGGVAIDLITLPIRATLDQYKHLVREDAKEAVRHDIAPTSEIALAGVPALTPAFSALVAGGAVIVAGTEHWPLAASCAVAFQYTMNLTTALTGGNTEQFRIFPSLTSDESGLLPAKEPVTFVSYGEPSPSASSDVLSRVEFVRQPA